MISGGSTPTAKKSWGRTTRASPRHSTTKHRSKNMLSSPTSSRLMTTTVSATATPSATACRPGSTPSVHHEPGWALVWLTAPT